VGAILSSAVWGENSGLPDGVPPGAIYTNIHLPEVPWSVHYVRVDRADGSLQLRSQHAGGGALGLTTLSAQVLLTSSDGTIPIAALNGDFYQRDKAYAGDPRGLQLVNGEVLSAPSGGVCFWVDAFGHLNLTNVQSLFQITWPSGAATPFGLNGDRRTNRVEVYTPALGSSTHTHGGLELVLESAGTGPWLPLAMGETYLAKVRELRESGDSPLLPGTMVVSVNPTLRSSLPAVQVGAVLKLSTGSSPRLWGAKTAIGGGPVLVNAGRKLKLGQPAVESYEFSSMQERHPRSAIGWNQQYLYLVEVDGRQKNLSVGMTLEELAAYMVRLGCEQAMNLDGGGSSTLWFAGSVRNSPCDGKERPIANSLLLVRSTPIDRAAAGGASAKAP